MRNAPSETITTPTSRSTIEIDKKNGPISRDRGDMRPWPSRKSCHEVSQTAISDAEQTINTANNASKCRNMTEASHFFPSKSLLMHVDELAVFDTLLIGGLIMLAWLALPRLVELDAYLLAIVVRDVRGLLAEVNKLHV